jgi:hypothetical protein
VHRANLVRARECVPADELDDVAKKTAEVDLAALAGVEVGHHVPFAGADARMERPEFESVGPAAASQVVVAVVAE